MDTMHQFKKSVDSLKDVNLSTAAKIENYSSLRNSFLAKLTQEEAVKNEGTLRCLFNCIRSDVVSESANLRQSVLTILDLMCKSPWTNFIARDLIDVCVHLTFDDVTKGTDDVQAVTLKCLECVLRQLILQNDCDPETILLKASQGVARKKIVELYEKVCEDLPKQLSSLFFYEKIVPAMFNTSSIDIRAFLVEFVVASLPTYEIGLLSLDKQEKFKTNTKKIYVERTVQLLEAEDPSWTNVWIFLVRCHGKKLHMHSDIMNALLKVVEVAFRSKVLVNNSAAYDCWRELINVYSLDLEQMCTPKYMKLLLLPLRNNSLKNGNLTRKRFEVWAHLIGILQEKSFELCLRQYLEFCFGPLGENPLITRGNPSIGSPARNDPDLWQSSARALLELIGHQKHVDDDSLGCSNHSLLKLEAPLITTDNFMAMDYIIINSVGECCSLILNRMNKESTKKLGIMTITSLWESLFHIINRLDKMDQDSSIRRVTALLAVFIELSNETPAYFDYVLKPIFELFSNENFFRIDIQRINTQLLFPLLKKFFKHNDAVFLGGKDTILELLRCSKNTHNKNNWLEETFEVFLKSDPRQSNLKGLLLLWVDCADVLNNLCDFPTGQTENVIQGVGIGFMLWPVLNMFRLSPENPIVTVVAQTWGNTFANMLKTYTKESLTVLMDIQTGIDSSPAIACHVAKLFPAFLPLLDTEPNHKFVMTLLNLTSTLLGAPTVTKEIKGLILPALLLIMQYFNEETEKKLKYSDFQHLCQCFEYLLRIHKEYSILNSLESFLDNIPRTFQENVPQSLRAVFDALKVHSDDNISQKAQHLSSKFIKCLAESSSKTQETFLQPKFVHLSRAAKITNMAIAVPKSPKVDNSEGTTVLRLLGHKVETSSPVRVRGSQLGNTNESQKRKAAYVFPEVKRSKVRVDDEEASFVLIDEPYQFDPAKLSEHQIEVMKHRRSDIPALYQDLTQSQSNSESFINKCTDIQNKVEENSELGASNNHNGTSNQTEVEVTSEVLFDTEDLVNVDLLMIPISNEKIKRKKDVEDKSVLVNSGRNFQNYPGVEVNQKLVVIPKNKESVGDGTEKTKEVSSVNQPKRGRPRILKPKQLNKTTNAKKIECKTSDTALPSSELHLEEDNTSAIKNSGKPVDVNLQDSCSARIDLKIQNPSMKKIEAMIAEDCPTNYNQGFASPVLKQNTTSNEVCQQENIPDENKPCIVNEDHKNLSDEDKRKQKIVVALNKLKMDIVGGDAFVRNLNLTERVRTRRSADVATLALRSGTRINYDSDDSKSSSSSDSSRKSKLRATVKLIEKTAKDKLTLSPKNSNKLRVAPSSPSKSSLKLAQVQSKNSNLEVEKDEVSPNKQIKKRRRSVSALEEPAQSGEENRNPRTRSKSVTPEKLSPITENLRRSPRSDKNWIAQVNKSLVECAKNNKMRARKSLATALESASKADISNNQSKVATKPEQSKPNLFEAESKIAGNLEFTITLVSDAESPSSEDVIESSQESAVDIKLCPNVDSPLKNIKKGIDLEIEEVLAHLKKRKEQNVDTVGIVIANRTDNSQVVASSSSSSSCQDSVNSIELDKLSPFSPDELMRMDLASLTKPAHSDTCEMDTETLELLSQTPTKNSLSIPTSPIGSDTPNRTSELISNTLDISPIKLVPKTESNKEKTTPDLFDSEPSTSSKNSISIAESQVKQRSDTKSPSPPESNINSVQDTPHQQPSCSTISDKTNQRSLKLLRMLPHTPLPENYKIQKVKQTFKPFVASPKTHRIKIMMQPFEKKSESKDVEEIVDLDDFDEEPMNVIQERDILKFVKELPSPMASPKCSILKRKAPEVRDEGLSPPRKKRVNFSDPPTTCEKVFFKDKNEHFHGKKDEYSEDTGYSNGTSALQMENMSTSSSNTDPPILEPMEYIEPPVLEAMKNEPPLLEAVKNMPTLSANNFTSAEAPNLEEVPSEKETESLAVETQGSIDVTIPHLLEYNQPILPEFVNCKESIDCVVGKMASPLFVQVLTDALEEKNICTVGDLAKLSEIEVTRLPFRTPKVLVVRTTLRKFISQKSGDNGNVEPGSNKHAEDKLAMSEDKSGFCVEEKSSGTNSDQEQKRNSVLVTDRPKLVAGDSLPTTLLSPTSSSSKVRLVSSIVIKPAHTVAQNSTRIDRSPRRVPLIKVTTSNTPTCSTFVQLAPVVAANVKPSGAKESDCSKPVLFGNAEEREKLRIRIPELIADFQEMREKVKRQGLSTTSLYELIIEIVGTEEFVAILQGNKALSINHFVKNDDWCTLLKEILHNIGLDKTVSCLCNAWKVTPAKVVNCVIEHIVTEKKGKFRSASLETIAHRVLKRVPLHNILQKFGMRQVVDALCEMNNSLQFTVEDFFQHATFRFSPSLDQIVPSFGNINIVHCSDDTPLSNSNKKDLEVFINRVGTLADPKFPENCKNQISETKDIIKCVPEEKKEEVTCKMSNDLPLPNQKKVVMSMADKMSLEDQRALIFSMFDKMPDIDVFDCCTDYFRQRLQRT